ncbi:hypothetical protein PpBr36_04324 [Pyricularia pennisetigena]|uniref:hypothetical protein n=1 Tax=Pyricularia pennisetigena TaxID=1578925 RepID=UPI0011502F22|nr:hypothetical protein PpBr36_04324 [Pyricularia pennisetigena]TLS26841.1 hypothetical protein PpBr36_04324 [Pyricularia pennisetigena]
MTVYQDPGHFCHARWQQWVLTPFWILQFTMLLSMSGIFIFRLIETSNQPMVKGKTQDDLILQHVWEATNVAFPLIAAALTGAEVFRFFYQNITPSWMVLSHILKTFFASIVLALDVTVYVKRVKDPYVTPGLAIGCALVLITCVPAVYVTVVYRRLMKHEYHHPGCQGLKKPNLSGRKEGDKAPSLSLTTPLSDSGSLGQVDKMGGYLTTETGDDMVKKEEAGPGIQRSRTIRLSLASFKSLKRSKTISSRKAPSSPAPYDVVDPESTDTNHWTAPVDVPLEKYTHERCTAFDEFIQRRLSGEDMDKPDGSWMGGAIGSYRPRPSNLDFSSASRRSSSGYSVSSSLHSPLGLPRAPLPMPTALMGSSSRITSRSSHVGVLGSVPETAEPNGEPNAQQQRHFSMGRLRSMAPDPSWATEPIRRVTIAGTGARYSKFEPMQGEWPLRADSDVWVPASAFELESQPLHHKDGSS